MRAQVDGMIAGGVGVAVAEIWALSASSDRCKRSARAHGQEALEAPRWHVRPGPARRAPHLGASCARARTAAQVL